MQNLLVAGAGIVLGGAIVVATGSLQSGQPQAEDQEQQDADPEETKQEERDGESQSKAFGKRRVRSRVSLLNEQEVLEAVKIGGLPRNLSSNQLSRGMTMKKKGGASAAGELPKYGQNYQTLLRRQSTK